MQTTIANVFLNACCEPPYEPNERACDNVAQKDYGKRLFQRYLKKPRYHRTRPAARGGEWYRDKNKQEPFAVLFDFAAFSEQPLMLPVSEPAKNIDSAVHTPCQHAPRQKYDERRKKHRADYRDNKALQLGNAKAEPERDCPLHLNNGNGGKPEYRQITPKTCQMYFPPYLLS